MSEHKEPIPSMLYNAAVGGHVANSQQIIDENLNREQNDINQEIVGAVPYNATTPNGMGRVMLKKTDNFKQVVEAQTNGNTIFVIKYDFTLTGNVTIPSNCVLQFDGGSINGAYTLTGNNTCIMSVPIKIFNLNVSLDGVWNVPEAYVEWFGAVGDGTTDDRVSINRTLELFHSVKLLAKSYTIGSVDSNNRGIIIPGYRTLKGSYRDELTSKVSSIIKVADNVNCLTAVYISNKSCVLSDFSVKSHTYEDVRNSCVGCSAGHRISIDRVDVAGAYFGFDLQIYMSSLKNCTASYCSVGFYVHGSVTSGDPINNINQGYSIGTKYTSVNLTNCYAVDGRLYGYILGGITYSVMNNCAADGCGCPNGGTYLNTDFKGHAYKFLACDSITINSCGCETCHRVIFAHLCQSLIFNACNFLIRNKTGVVLDSGYTLENIVLIRYSVNIVLNISRINISSNLSTAYTNTSALLMLSDDNSKKKMLIYILSNYADIDILNIKTDGPNITIKQNLLLINYIYENLNTRPTFSTDIERVYRKGYSIFDETLNKPIWLKGTYNSQEVWVDATGATV